MIGNKLVIGCVEAAWQMARRQMPVSLLWAVPAVIFVGGVGYFLVHAGH